MKRKILSKREIKDINEQLKIFNFEFDKKDHVELFEDSIKFLKLNGETYFLNIINTWVPCLKLLLKKEHLIPEIIVDMGAVKFVTSGADIMRPGIVSYPDNLLKDSVVVIKDVINHKPLAIGVSLMDSNTMCEITSGKAVKNIHYVGDEYWN